MKSALVTGSAKNLGKILALRLASLGYFTFIHCNKSKIAANQVLNEIKKSGGQGMVLEGDLGSQSDMKRMVGAVGELGHPLSTLVLNVGIYSTGSLLSFPVNKFEEILRVNLLSSHFIMQLLLPLMDKKGGTIFTIGYTGVEYPLSAEKTTAYSISKTGLLIWTRSLAVALAKKKIRVNMLSPGQQQSSVDLPKNVKKHIPMGRAGKHEEFADFMEYLISDKAAYITGQNIEIAGGFMSTLKSPLN